MSKEEEKLGSMFQASDFNGATHPGHYFEMKIRDQVSAVLEAFIFALRFMRLGHIGSHGIFAGSSSSSH